MAEAYEPVGDTLSAGQTLKVGQRLQARNGHSHLCMQEDGNLVVYGHYGKVLWSANSSWPSAVRAQATVLTVNYVSAHGGDDAAGLQARLRAFYRGLSGLTMQPDGNACVYALNQFAWGAMTVSHGNAERGRLTMQDDGNLCIYDNDGKYLWGTQSNIGREPIQFRYLKLVNAANGVAISPMIWDLNRKTVWCTQNPKWNVLQGDSKVYDLSSDINDRSKELQPWKAVKVGCYVYMGDSCWPSEEFVFNPDCNTQISIRKWGASLSGNTDYEGQEEYTHK